MSFDATKDKVLGICTEEFSPANHLEMKLASYDNGEPKIQIARFALKDSSTGVKFRRLGRMTLAEVKWVLTAVAELIASHEEGKGD